MRLAFILIFLTVLPQFANAGLFDFFKKESAENLLTKAVEHGNKDGLLQLIEQGYPVNGVNENGSTALIEAAKSGNNEFANILIKSGADVNAVDNYGRTALHYSAKNGFTDVAQTLVKSGADATIKDNFGMTAIKEAINLKNVNMIKVIDPTALAVVQTEAAFPVVGAATAAASAGGGISTTAVVTGAGVAAAGAGVAAAAGGGGGGSSGGSSGGGSAPTSPPSSPPSNNPPSTSPPSSQLEPFPDPTGSTLLLIPSAPKTDSILTYETAEYDNQYGLGSINASAAYARGYTGYRVLSDRTTITSNKVLVAVIDNGVDSTHPDLAPNISTHSRGFTDASGGSPEPLPGDFHGTHVAGTIAATKDFNADPSNMHGVAYNAEILAIKSGSGSSLFFSDIIKGFDYAVNYDGTAPHSGAKIINNSWSYGKALNDSDFPKGQISGTLINMLSRAISKDAIIVFAAGNEGRSEVDIMAGMPWHFPQFFGNYLSVVAVDSSNNIASFSNRCGLAKAWCIAAPGVAINSTNEGGGYRVLQGTSMAAPHVSGAAAVLLGAFPNLTPKQVVEIILATATDLGGAGVDDIYGNGLLNLDKATQPLGVVTIPLYASLSGGSTTLSESRITTSSAFGDAFTSSSARFAILDSYERAYNVNLASVANGRDTFEDFDKNFQYFGESMLSDESKISKNITFAYADVMEKEADSPEDEADRFARMSFKFSGGESETIFNYNVPMENAFSPSILSDRKETFKVGKRSFLSFVEKGSSYLSSFKVNSDTSLRIGSFYGENEGDAVFGFVNDVAYNSDRYAAGFQFGMMNEENRFLGSKSEGAFALGENTPTWFSNISGKYAINDKISMSGDFSYGVSFPDIAANSLFNEISQIASTSFNMTLRREKLFSEKDSFDFSLSQPLRVSSGSAIADLPVARDLVGNILRESADIDLSPTGREIDMSAFYNIESGKRESLNLGAIYRIQPGHDKNAQADMVFMGKYQISF